MVVSTVASCTNAHAADALAFAASHDPSRPNTHLQAIHTMLKALNPAPQDVLFVEVRGGEG